MQAASVHLPDEVVTRIGERALEPPWCRRARGSVVEVRATDVVDVSGTHGAVTLDGYATVWETPYDVYGGPPLGFREVIARGAADKTLAERDDVVLLVNHDADSAWGLPLASTRNGSLVLSADDHGLRVRARVDPEASPLHAFLVSSIAEQRATQMSMAFQAIRQEWNHDYTDRRITELRLFDVSAVTYPANPATVIQVARGMPLRLARAVRDRATLRRR